MMAQVKESQRIPPPENVDEVFLRTVDAAPAIVFVDRQGQRVVVPVVLRDVPAARVAA